MLRITFISVCETGIDKYFSSEKRKAWRLELGRRSGSERY